MKYVIAMLLVSDGIAGPTTVEIVDGADIQPSLIALDRTVLNIRGGVTQRAVGMNDQSTLNVFGGLVGGEDISDGSPLDVRLFDNGATLGLEQIVLHQIPEPSTFSICLIGLFLLLLNRRVRGRPVTRPLWQARRREIAASRAREPTLRYSAAEGTIDFAR